MFAKGIWWIICYFCIFFKQQVSTQDEGSFDSSSNKAFRNKSQVGCFCMYTMLLDVVKMLTFKTNSAFWICLVVAFGFMEFRKNVAVKKFRKPRTVSEGKVCYKLSALLMVNANKWGTNVKNWGVAPTCHPLTVMCCYSSFVFPTFSVFKVVYHEYLLHFLLCQSCRRLRNVSFGGPHIPFLGLIKRPCHGWLGMMS